MDCAATDKASSVACGICMGSDGCHFVRGNGCRVLRVPANACLAGAGTVAPIFARGSTTRDLDRA